ncbi:MAG: DNA topoisomerase IB [Roseiflexaceae bacterium]
MTIPDPIETAQSAGLRYVSDTQPGIRRRRAGKGFSYLGPDGRPIRDAATLRRIKALAIPPAWKEVWICPSSNGHIQATGRDARGRKQYRYDTRWRATRDETKYSRMIAFAGALPRIRAQVQQDMAEPGLPRTKVLATVVRLLESTLIRVGNEEYARANKSFGLTTMRDQHVQINGSTLHFEFRGKSGVKHNLDLRDRRLAQIVKRCRDIPGHELFQYIDENGERQTIGSGDVNEYLRAVSGDDFTAKDFRTWAGTVLAALALKEFETFDSQTQAKKNVVRAIETVAERLGNTTAVCRKCYIHPAVVDAYLDGTLIESLRQPTEHELVDDLSDLPPEEAAVLALLQQRLAVGQESGA